MQNVCGNRLAVETHRHCCSYGNGIGIGIGRHISDTNRLTSHLRIQITQARIELDGIIVMCLCEIEQEQGTILKLQTTLCAVKTPDFFYVATTRKPQI